MGLIHALRTGEVTQVAHSHSHDTAAARIPQRYRNVGPNKTQLVGGTASWFAGSVTFDRSQGAAVIQRILITSLNPLVSIFMAGRAPAGRAAAKLCAPLPGEFWKAPFS